MTNVEPQVQKGEDSKMPGSTFLFPDMCLRASSGDILKAMSITLSDLRCVAEGRRGQGLLIHQKVGIHLG